MLAPHERYALLLMTLIAMALLATTLVLETVGKTPFATPFSRESPDGALVSHTGTVEKVTVIPGGGHVIARIGGITVFIPGSAGHLPPLQEGERITLIGTAATYRGEREIVVSSAGDIRRS